jgi:hypothetical protein
MQEQILVGRGAEIRREPAAPFRRMLEEAARVPSKRLEFMTKEHHAVRDAAVRELARRPRPLPPEELARATGLAADRVTHLLDELESRLFFIVRNDAGEVSWAFPVTSERTPHRLRFGTGEDIYAA